MSITTPDDRVSEYHPVAPTTEFAALFPVFDDSDLAVFHDGVQRFDFTVSATYVNSISNDAKAVFDDPGITGHVLVVGARSPRRNSRFNDGLPIPTRDQNTALDSIVAAQQEIARDVRRSMKAEFGHDGLTVSADLVDGDTLMVVPGGKVGKGPQASHIASAESNALAAEAAAILAQKWAINPEDSPVFPGLYSAFHWARKALEWASSGVAGVVSFNGRSGEVTPEAGDYALEDIEDLPEALQGLLDRLADTWALQPIGVPLPIWPNADPPPIDNDNYRYVCLEAGLTGSGQYNEGVLINEDVSGSAPLIVATADIDLDGSPLDGETVHLLNTEGRIARPSSSPGALQDDAIQNIVGTFTANRLTRGASSGLGTGPFGGDNVGGFDGLAATATEGSSGRITFNASLAVRAANETRMRNIGVQYYMRIK